MGSRPNGSVRDPRAALTHIVLPTEVLMSVPPRPSERAPADWNVAGERPTRSAQRTKPDKVGLGLVGLVLVALLVALVLLFVL